MMSRCIAMVALFACVHHTRACTTIIVGRKATADGSVMCSHSNDGEGGIDPRLVRVPPRDHAQGDMRPIYYAPESYPRYVGSSRGVAAYKAVGNQSDFSPLGHIPQVLHTFGYFEQTYGALNEHQVGIGESTCSGVFGTSAVGHGGKALMSIDTLSQIAMERATSSRAAVELMGSLAEKYGFYGAGSFEGSAESLMVTDPQEGYIFHILPDPTGTSAIWAARRVPDDEVGVVANVFVIRGLNMSEPGNYLCSKSVHEVAQAKGWWKPADGLLDFTATYSDGEYAHKYYSGRRVWGVYQKLAPSLNLSPTYGEWRKSKPYPVSAKPDHKLSVADVAAAMRSYYEGTAYDQTVGLAAGPFGTPDHVSGGSAGGKVVGNWERTIGLYRTSDSHIVQSRHWLPSAVGGVLWWGPHAAPYTVYVPFAAGMTALPDSTLGIYSTLDKSTLFWGVRYLANLCQLKRSYAIQDVNALQDAWHKKSLQVQADLDAAATGGKPPAGLTSAYLSHAAEVLKALFAASDDLFFKYADGWVSEVAADGTFSSRVVPAPDWWLRAVNYTDGPPPVPP